MLVNRPPPMMNRAFLTGQGLPAVPAVARFSPSVRDIRMLRIDGNNDLMPAVASVIS